MKATQALWVGGIVTTMSQNRLKNPEVVCSSLTTRTRRPTRRAVRKRRRLQQKALLVGVYLALTAGEEKPQSVAKSTKASSSGLFGSDSSDDDGGLFGTNDKSTTSNTTSAGNANKTSGGGLFGSDDESDDDIFEYDQAKRPQLVAPPKATANATASKGGLFFDAPGGERGRYLWYRIGCKNGGTKGTRRTQ